MEERSSLRFLDRDADQEETAAVDSAKRPDLVGVLERSNDVHGLQEHGVGRLLRPLRTDRFRRGECEELTFLRCEAEVVAGVHQLMQSSSFLGRLSLALD